jgi:cobalt-zinc-cadmium efflux system outer membrane protein
LAAQTRVAFYDHQATAEKLELQGTVLQALSAAVEMTERLHEAGNVTDLNLTSERSFYEEARIEFTRAESELYAQREHLNALMGVWGEAGTNWTSSPTLSEPQPVEHLLDDVEGRAITASLDLASSRQRVAQLTSKANLEQARGWLPALHAGVAAERQDTEWSVGPVAELELPLFDHGQGETAVAVAELRREVQLQADLAIRLRARTRAVALRLKASADSAEYYRATVLPLRERVLEETQLQYNAMGVGVFQLLQAKRDQINAHSHYIDLVHDYWAARTELEQLIAGSLPASERPLAPFSASSAGRPDAGH